MDFDSTGGGVGVMLEGEMGGCGCVIIFRVAPRRDMHDSIFKDLRVLKRPARRPTLHLGLAFLGERFGWLGDWCFDGLDWDRF